MTESLEKNLLNTAERVARFMETLDEKELEGVFAENDVTIIENFAPHVFKGPEAVQSWAKGFKAHASGIANLKHKFGTPQDFSVTDDLAFFTLPTTWNGIADGSDFSEQGGWAFVFVRNGVGWKIKSYGWAVTNYQKK